MKNAFAFSAAVVAAIAAVVPAFASGVAVTQVESTTVKSEPVMMQNVIAAPDVAANTTCVSTTTVKDCNTALVPTLTPSVFVVNPPPAFLPGMVITVVRPDDLITRQAELNARILVEQSAGTITTAQANDLLNRLGQVAAIEANEKANGSLSWKQVEHTYRSFDRISHDLDTYSTDRNHALAGSFIVL